MRELLLGCILATSITQAQVGIGTTSPQEQLHIANGDVRVDNLTPTATSGTNVSVDANGTLILSNSSVISGRVTFDGSAIAIQGATSSRLRVGVYQITFDTPMSNADYLVFLTGMEYPGLTPTLTVFNNTINSFEVMVNDDFFRNNGRFDRVDGVDLEFMFKVEPIN
jgi:hypothetical protein